MDTFSTKHCANITFPGTTNPERIVVFFYTEIPCDKLKKYENIEVPEAEIACSGIIPGLYVYNDIITEE
jgi:hypothetical protein